MATPNGTNESKVDVAKIGDEFVDTQYLKPNSSVEDYEKEPWEHCQDATSAYLSLRLEDRSEFLRNLDEPRRTRVNEELKEIEKVRKQFSSYANKKGLMDKLHSSKKEWREEVARNVRNFEREVEKFQRELNERKTKVDSNHPGFKAELKNLRRPQNQKINEGSELSRKRKDLEEEWAERLDQKYRRHWELIQRLKGWEAPARSVPAQSQQEATDPNTAGLSPGEEDVKPEPLYGLKASVMYFRLDEDTNTLVGYNSEHPKYDGEFPNQKISMHEILNEPNENPLMEDCPQDCIRYFHFPANNMSWIETAIARYYKEDPKPIDDRKPYDPNARKTEKLLALTPPFFSAQNSDKCFQLPYLHWETSSRRAKMVQIINEGMQYEAESPGFSRVVEAAAKTVFESRRKFTLQRPKVRTLLGEYLMTLAKVAEEVDYGVDERLLREHVNANPPLHIRPLIIIDQCSCVFFDRASPLDQRPEIMDLFASAIGTVTEMTTIAYHAFWRALRTGNIGARILNFNPEGVLFTESEDIAEELEIMKRVYSEQLKVVKDFNRHIYNMHSRDKQGEVTIVKQLLLEMMQNKVAFNHRNVSWDDREAKAKAKRAKELEATPQEAERTLELIESRQAEIQDLHDLALRARQQAHELLSFKQQQASMVGVESAIYSNQQGRIIVVFTIVTIFFLPLSFFATVFGMNNAEINGASWMTLNEQIGYMFRFAAIVVWYSYSTKEEEGPPR
ncbi:hypothetical protein DL762_000489 [Monosporascus cannonballus]|uniref:Uncharacterized protein n=1 Tax=Monosporascus cannonballus TaxID=155416 RepID=A0ABY0HN21_9PEZI|nr:hypothetical protein DL762_000489 [Monosporascus cannonballus]